MLLPSKPVSQYRCMNLPITDDNDRAHKNDANALDIWSILLPGQVPHRSNSSHLFWNLEDTALVQTLSYRRKITYHLLLIDFFHKLISMQDVRHNVLHLHVAQPLPSLYMHQWVISRTSDNDAEVIRQFPFSIDLNKILSEFRKLRTKAEKPDLQSSQNGSKAQPGSKIWSWLMFS